MIILKQNTSAELQVKNSRFLSEAIIVHSPTEAKEIRNEKKAEYACNHVVYAFICGPQRNIMGCSDDGEPSGTAGRPTLEVLKGSGLTDVLLTTARWFGGTLLGTGGLVHAYTASAQAALKKAQPVELLPMKAISFHVPYPVYEQTRRLLEQFEFEIISEEFSADVVLSGRIRESLFGLCTSALNDLLCGKVSFTENPDISP